MEIDEKWFAGDNVWGSTFAEWIEFQRIYGYVPQEMIEALKSLPIRNHGVIADG